MTKKPTIKSLLKEISALKAAQDDYRKYSRTTWDYYVEADSKVRQMSVAVARIKALLRELSAGLAELDNIGRKDDGARTDEEFDAVIRGV